MQRPIKWKIILIWDAKDQKQEVFFYYYKYKEYKYQEYYFFQYFSFELYIFS